jgi:uncharacterized protein (DUF2225 family)
MSENMPVRQAKLTFFSHKKPITCPVCDSTVPKEEILSGSGRLIAGELTDELHRQYEKTQKFGKVYPLMYSVPVCPVCFFAGLPADFETTMRSDIKATLQKTSKERYNKVAGYFPPLSFTAPRTLNEGIASYLLALLTYELLPADYIPTFKQGLFSLRAAWLCDDLNRLKPEENFDYMSLILHRKASFYYRRAVELEENGTEPFSKLSFLGPDQDNNFGFEGVLYLTGLLEFKYGSKSNPAIRQKALEASRSSVSRIVGMGKSSRSKPTAILELARQLYEKIKNELAEHTPEPSA